VFLKHDHSLFDLLGFRARVVCTGQVVTLSDVKTRFLLEISVPVKQLGRLIFLDVGLKELSELVPEVGRPFFAAHVSEDRVLHRVVDVGKSVVLQEL
jgi:hypothetical protein